MAGCSCATPHHCTFQASWRPPEAVRSHRMSARSPSWRQELQIRPIGHGVLKGPSGGRGVHPAAASSRSLTVPVNLRDAARRGDHRMVKRAASRGRHRVTAPRPRSPSSSSTSSRRPRAAPGAARTRPPAPASGAGISSELEPELRARGRRPRDDRRRGRIAGGDVELRVALDVAREVDVEDVAPSDPEPAGDGRLDAPFLHGVGLGSGRGDDLFRVRHGPDGVVRGRAAAEDGERADVHGHQWDQREARRAEVEQARPNPFGAPGTTPRPPGG